MEPNSSTPTGREAVHEGWHARLILSGVQAGVAGWATYMAWQAFQSSVSITLGTQTGSGTPRVLIGSSITLPADEALAIADGSDVSQTVSAGLPAIKGASQSAKGASQGRCSFDFLVQQTRVLCNTLSGGVHVDVSYLNMFSNSR
eukprot:m.185800 g.185800  ORF g.185800 m.185800 type:complete len:145 (+) comp14736_c0_seq2:394-828(+)